MPKALRRTLNAGKRGRPYGEWVDHTETILARLCDGQSLTEIARDLGFPESSVRHAALDDKPEGFGPRYARAREIGVEARADRLRALVRADYPRDADGRIDGAAVQARRLEVDLEKWLFSKQAPRAYGEKLDVTSGGEKLSPVAMLPPELLLKDK